MILLSWVLNGILLPFVLIFMVLLISKVDSWAMDQLSASTWSPGYRRDHDRLTLAHVGITSAACINRRV
jgi:Mn2+/Fe2+ NRAMP family transporter